MFEAIKRRKEIHSLEILVYCLTTYSLFISPPFTQKKPKQHNAVCNAHPNGFGCRLNLSKYHHLVSMLWQLRLPMWLTSSGNMCKHRKQNKTKQKSFGESSLPLPTFSLSIAWFQACFHFSLTNRVGEAQNTKQ